MVAHDLSGAASPLISSAEMLRFEVLQQQEQLLLVRSITRSAHRVDRLGKDLVAVAGLLSHRFEIHPGPMDLVELVRELLALHEGLARGQRLSLQAPARLQGWWDRDRVGQVLGNLLSNAVKYSPAGSEIRVLVERAGSWAVVRVQDQGPGIPADELAGLFQPFTRLGRDALREGVGLGLHIAQRIAEAHGGRLTAASEPGQGSVFSLWLPGAEEARPTPSRAGDPDEGITRIDGQ